MQSNWRQLFCFWMHCFRDRGLLVHSDRSKGGPSGLNNLLSLFITVLPTIICFVFYEAYCLLSPSRPILYHSLTGRYDIHNQINNMILCIIISAVHHKFTMAWIMFFSSSAFHLSLIMTAFFFLVPIHSQYTSLSLTLYNGCIVYCISVAPTWLCVNQQVSSDIPKLETFIHQPIHKSHWRSTIFYR